MVEIKSLTKSTANDPVHILDELRSHKHIKPSPVADESTTAGAMVDQPKKQWLPLLLILCVLVAGVRAVRDLPAHGGQEAAAEKTSSLKSGRHDGDVTTSRNTRADCGGGGGGGAGYGGGKGPYGTPWTPPAMHNPWMVSAAAPATTTMVTTVILVGAAVNWLAHL
ncbi:hypothetical protein ACP4OV_006997 [Aristida adscensionis]